MIDPTRLQPTVVEPPPRRRWGRTTLIVVGVIVGVCTVANLTRIAVAGSLAGTDPVASMGPSQNEPPEPGLGQPVRDGQFEFVVQSVTCGPTHLDNGWLLHATAKGQYCVATMTVRNIGSQARRFADGLQQGIGANGQRYEADTGAGVVANGNGDAIWNVVNPGVVLWVKVVYDVPVGATISALGAARRAPVARGDRALFVGVEEGTRGGLAGKVGVSSTGRSTWTRSISASASVPALAAP